MKKIIFAILCGAFCLSNISAQSARRETARGLSQTESISMSLTSSTTETTLYSFTVPAGGLGDNKQLRFQLTTVISTVLSVPVLTAKVKFGASTLTLFSGLAVSVNLTNRPIIVQGYIQNPRADFAKSLRVGSAQQRFHRHHRTARRICRMDD